MAAQRPSIVACLTRSVKVMGVPGQFTGGAEGGERDLVVLDASDVLPRCFPPAAVARCYEAPGTKSPHGIRSWK